MSRFPRTLIKCAPLTVQDMRSGPKVTVVYHSKEEAKRGCYQIDTCKKKHLFQKCLLSDNCSPLRYRRTDSTPPPQNPFSFILPTFCFPTSDKHFSCLFTAYKLNNDKY